MSEHTSAPWQQDGSHIYGPDPLRRIVCQLHYAGRGYQSEDADNGHLILAAPDLLEACRYMHKLLVDMGHGGLAGAILGENAIAKAEGKRLTPTVMDGHAGDQKNLRDQVNL